MLHCCVRCTVCARACVTMWDMWDGCRMGRTPPMGWNSWCTGSRAGTESLCNAFGKDPCSETQVREVADAMVEQGMTALGYTYVNLDDCWSATNRSADGELQPDTSRFPSGIAALADYVHSRGLLLGLYTDVGTKTCKGDRPGSFGHYAQDAKTLARWGVDFVKMDHCGLPSGHSDLEMYTNMSVALNATGRSHPTPPHPTFPPSLPTAPLAIARSFTRRQHVMLPRQSTTHATLLDACPLLTSKVCVS